MYSMCYQRLQIILCLIFVLLVIPLYASPLQYCRVDESQRTDQCLALSSYRNESSNANDFYLLISAKFEDRGGFAAFGTGETMDGALMFVIYPGENEGDVTTSIRTTNYHYPPETSAITPDYRVLRTWVEGSYHNAQLVCYSCDEWTRNKATVTSQKQSWIFANHYEFRMQTNDISKPLTLHTDYATFELDMTASHYTTGNPSAPELVDNGRHSVGAAKANFWTDQRLFALHGLLLAFAFIVLMPFGIAGIRSKHHRSYTIHWAIQITSVLTSMFAIILGISMSWRSFEVSTLHGAHQLIGFLLLICLGLTPALGYLHHLRFLKLGHPTNVTIWHRCLGASTLTGGWVNVILGLFIAMQPWWYFLTAVICMAISTSVIYSAPKLRALLERRGGNKTADYQAVDDEDAGEELLRGEMKEERL